MLHWNPRSGNKGPSGFQYCYLRSKGFRSDLRRLDLGVPSSTLPVCVFHQGENVRPRMNTDLIIEQTERTEYALFLFFRLDMEIKSFGSAISFYFFRVGRVTGNTGIFLFGLTKTEAVAL